MKIGIIILSLAAITSFGCQASETTKGGAASTSVPAPAPTSTTAIRQRVEQMQQVDYMHMSTIMSAKLQKALEHCHSIYNINEDDSYVGFEWNAGVLDACGEPKVEIKGVTVIDDAHAKVNMRYVDSPCGYDIPYVLCLVWENREWLIDDVEYPEQTEPGWGTLLAQCDTFYDALAESYKTDPADDILENMLSMEPTDENYTDPASIYYNNPEMLKSLTSIMKNSLELLKQNPGYRPVMGKQVNDMIARISKHI